VGDRRDGAGRHDHARRDDPHRPDHAVANRADAEALAARQREARRRSPREAPALSATGKARFAAAMPYWENAQREAGRIMPLDVVNALGKQVRRAVAQPRDLEDGRRALGRATRSMRSRPGFPRRLGVPAGERRGRPRTSSRYARRATTVAAIRGAAARGGERRARRRETFRRLRRRFVAADLRGPAPSGSLKGESMHMQLMGGGDGERAPDRPEARE
jgi:hypothetical protein